MKGEAVRLESLRSATPLRTRPSLATTKWRLKQLGYAWHRSLMRRYEDFSVVTRDSLGLYVEDARPEVRHQGLRADNEQDDVQGASHANG